MGDLSAIDLLEGDGAAQGRGLAAAGRARSDDRLAAANVQVDARERLAVAEALVDVPGQEDGLATSLHHTPCLEPTLQD